MDKIMIKRCFSIIILITCLMCFGCKRAWVDPNKLPKDQQSQIIVQNTTGATIEKISLKISETDPFLYSCSIKDGDSYTMTLRRDVLYAVVFTDEKDNNYAKSIKCSTETEPLLLTKNDFRPETDVLFILEEIYRIWAPILIK